VNGPKNTSISGELNRGLRVLTVATVVLYLVLATIGVVGYLDGAHRRAEIAELADKTHAALCVFVDDLERRVEISEQFLKDNPNGIPGISDETIQTSIDNQLRTIDTLSGLGC